jgi:hypothetical protein
MTQEENRAILYDRALRAAQDAVYRQAVQHKVLPSWIDAGDMKSAMDQLGVHHGTKKGAQAEARLMSIYALTSTVAEAVASVYEENSKSA